MNPMNIYLATCRYVMSTQFSNRDTWADLYRYLPYLRQALSCYVCRNLAQKPFSAAHKNCQHFVCEKCIGGKMKLKPQCSWCKKYDGFVENSQLRIVILGFKRICHYIHSTPIWSDLKTNTPNGESNSLLEIIEEGMQFSDDFKMNSQLPLPPVLQTNKTKTNKSLKSPKTSFVRESVANEPIASTSSTAHSNEQNDDLSPPVLEKSEEIDQELQIDVDVESHELSPTASDELIDVCKLPSPSEIHTKPVKRKKEPVLSFETFKNSKLLEHRLLTVNCIGPKGGNLRISSSPILELPVKKTKNSDEIKVCKCGRGGTNSRLTCLGQRCPCYIKKLPCINCKCKGCRNPRKATEPESRTNNNCITDSISISKDPQNENICVV